ncbi:MAG TPA: ABC transporter permease [Polyangiaceae bacterium]|nr:ABC transporter permease [Polyangiaceae bacterium]
MSVQSGSPSVPPLAPGSSLLARGRWGWSRLTRDPNPVWMRELRQSARLARTPVILMAITVAVALLISSVGGIASVTAEPAKVGVGIFHTFFSLAFALVTWLGPAVAANTIAGEKNGRTWEALALTSLTPARIARGKFLAAYTYVAMYLVMLAPVGALPFLFGGVTATEVILAFFCCFVFAALAVAFGLALSSKFQSSASAIIITLILALTTSFATFTGLGVALSVAVHEQWPGVAQGPPVWLPTAWVRADLGLPYLAFLVVLPAVAVLVPAWLFYEVTIANLAGPSDDRSTRLRVWTIVSSLALTGCCGIVAVATRHVDWAKAQGSFLFLFFLFVVLMVAGEPLGPSRRVRVAWDRAGRSRALRALGPGVVPATAWLVGLVLVAFAASIGVGLLTLTKPTDREVLLAFDGQLLAFLLFLCGLSAFFRTRAETPVVPRVLLVVTTVVAAIGPWIVMAIAGVVTQTSDGTLALASPSPTYAFVLAEEIQRSSVNLPNLILPAVLCSAGYVLFGLGLFIMAAGRAHTRLVQERERASQLEALLDAELQAEMEAAAPPEADGVPLPEPEPEPEPEAPR